MEVLADVRLQNDIKLCLLDLECKYTFMVYKPNEGYSFTDYKTLSEAEKALFIAIQIMVREGTNA